MSENYTIVYNTNCYRNNLNIVNVDLGGYAWVNNSMRYAFSGSYLNGSNLSSVTNINENVTDMSYAFGNCHSLVNAPEIPNSVTNMEGTFFYCKNLVNAPVIPNSVIDMGSTFVGCSNLVNSPVIPNNVSNMCGIFQSCFNLVNVPVIPNSVTDMQMAFHNCTSLVNAPVIPNSVTNMGSTFSRCTNLVNAPVIPESVNIIYSSGQYGGLFHSCENLTGDIYIHSENITYATNCFYNTSLEKNVYIHVMNNGVYTSTYNAFVNAGYSLSSRVNGALLMDMDAISVEPTPGGEPIVPLAD